MIEKIEKTLVAIAGLSIIALGAMITITVLTRSLLGWGVPDDVVIVKELMVFAIVLPLAAVSSARAHIAIEFIYNRLLPRTQAWLLAFSSLFALFSLIPIGYAAWLDFAHVVGVDAFFFGDLSLPKWPGRLAFFVGMLFFALRMSILLIKDLKAAVNSSSASSNS